MTALLSIRNLSKSYPGVVANSNIDLTIEHGKIHALLGENGAGKTTLVKAIYGLVQPDSGDMQWQGKSYAPAEPRMARHCGVAMVFQHFSLFEAMTVAENVALGMETPPPVKQLSERIWNLSNDYGLPLDPQRMIGDLSAGERQRVEIIRCLLQNPKLLIMDEPTSVLTPQEVEILFKALRNLADKGTAILYISHKLQEIKTLCDKATILRRGKVVDVCTPSNESIRDLAEKMVGTALKMPQRGERDKSGKVILKLEGLSLPAQSEFGVPLQNICLELRAGEILGIAGVAGNGQDEFLSALSGEFLAPREHISFMNQQIGLKGVEARRHMGLLCCPEERLGHAAAADLNLTENTYLTAYGRKRLHRFGVIQWTAVAEFSQEIVSAFDVRTPSVRSAARALSGGNLQKFVIGREILQRPQVLVVNQPTWGVDAAAAAFIRQALMDQVQAGAGVIVISQDLDELLEVSDRICALNAGKLSAICDATDVKTEDIGLMMGGASAISESHAHA